MIGVIAISVLERSSLSQSREKARLGLKELRELRRLRKELLGEVVRLPVLGEDRLLEEDLLL